MATKKVIPGEMTDVDVKFVSLVGKAANKQKIGIYKEDDDSAEQSVTEKEESIEKGLFKHIRDFFVKSQEVEEEIKPSFKSKMQASDVMENSYQAFSIFRETVREIFNSNSTQKKADYDTAVLELAEYLKSKVSDNQSIAKGDAFFNAESEESMNLEELTKVVKDAVQEAVAPIDEKVAKMEDPEAEEEIEKEETNEMDEIQKMIKASVEEVTKAMSEKLDRIEKSRGLGKSEEGDEEDTIEKSEKPDLFAGIFA
ncbi:hypothetical protein [Eubacterium sp.]|uniref:hypothetical protein n=1 Tax=Eubacterium sp. TaxID=142586 RepID=UPI002FCA5113